MKFTEIKAENIENDEIIVRFFGEFEMANKYGAISEKSAKPQAFTWPTLKYLLVNSNRDVDREELAFPEPTGNGQEVGEGAMRTRLRRVRDILKPLGLESTRGLILFSGGKYRVNPDYTIISDEEEFNLLWRRARARALKSPEGLEHCVEALELFRGPYLGRTKDVPWLKAPREHYRGEFCALCRETMRRMKALGDDAAAGLLWRRAIAVAPEDEALHKAIMSFLAERRLETELVRYASQLGLMGAAWLEDFEY